MNTEIIFTILCIIVIGVMLIYYIRRKKRIVSFITGVFTGCVALFIINRYDAFLGLDIHLNMFNIIGSIILGVPFVVFLVIMNFL